MVELTAKGSPCVNEHACSESACCIYHGIQPMSECSWVLEKEKGVGGD